MKLPAFLLSVLVVCCLQQACSKTGGIPPPPPPDPCSLISININGTVTNPSAVGATDGSIALSATGGTGFTFSNNGGSYQSSTSFLHLTAGTYNIVARNKEGCTASISFILTNPGVLCGSVNIVLTVHAGTNIPCESNSASIDVTAAGGASPYLYSVDGGGFQSGNSFSNVASGSHILVAKDANGCTGTASTTVSNEAAGSLFNQVKGVIQYHCQGCHNNTRMDGGINLAVDCNIVSNKLRIKERAVDGNPSPMPQTGLISSGERQKIIDWINAGGKYSD